MVTNNAFSYLGIEFVPYKNLDLDWESKVRLTVLLGLTPEGWNNIDFWKAYGNGEYEVFLLPNLGNMAVIPAHNYLFALDIPENQNCPAYTFLRSNVCCIRLNVDHFSSGCYFVGFEQSKETHISTLSWTDNIHSALRFNTVDEAKALLIQLPRWIKSKDIVHLSTAEKWSLLLSQQNKYYHPLRSTKEL